MPFVKGQSGNPAGKKPGTLGLTGLLRLVLDANDREEALALVKATVAQAKEGNGVALKIVWDRIDGLLVAPTEFDKWLASKTEEEKQAMWKASLEGKI